MRELPYLVTLITSLKADICYAYINQVTVYDKKYKELEYVEGQKIIDVLRYGGYVHFQFSQDAMLVDISEDGAFVITEDQKYPGSLIKLSTDHGNFFVVDSTNVTNIIPIWKDTTTMPQVGYDPLTKQFNYNLFCELLEKNKTTVEKLIKNHLIISGIGDTYGDMILKRAGINKRTKTGDINKSKAREIFDAIKHVLREAAGDIEDEEESAIEEE